MTFGKVQKLEKEWKREMIEASDMNYSNLNGIHWKVPKMEKNGCLRSSFSYERKWKIMVRCDHLSATKLVLEVED